MTTQEPFHVISFVRRKPGTTNEQFSNHWGQVHAPLVTPWLLKYGVTEYTQLHATTFTQAQWAKYGAKAGFQGFDFDGAAEITFPSYERLAAAYSDPYYVNVIKPESEKFLAKKIDVPMSTMGVPKKIIQDGKVVIEAEKEVKFWKEWEDATQEMKIWEERQKENREKAGSVWKDDSLWFLESYEKVYTK